MITTGHCDIPQKSIDLTKVYALEDQSDLIVAASVSLSCPVEEEHNLEQ
jgi:hypothetical protein